MTTRAPAKGARTVGAKTVKTPGKDQGKGDKQPASVLEIVPGKFNENDWMSLLENEDTEDFIADIFEGIWADASKQIQDIYIRRQLLPYTLMITENALSNVIQWAFLERDESQPKDGDFWAEDAEPIPCTMDNWGEGVVPSCREERPLSLEPTSLSVVEQTPSLETNLQIATETDMIENQMRGRTPSPTSGRVEEGARMNLMNIAVVDQSTYLKKSHEKRATKKTTMHSDDKEKQSSRHDILVIDAQPPKLEPFANLFQPTPMRTSRSSSPNPTPATLVIKPRRMVGPKGSQLDSEDLASTTNLTETTIMKTLKKHESKFFDDQRLEEVIGRAPVAAHAILKSILSRPPGYRDLELDDFGNVIAIAKLDPDKLGSRSVRVKYDVVKSRKAQIENRPAPVKQTHNKSIRSDPAYTPVKLVLPEHSTEVGDLIQPVPGVLYEDSKLKKGDPRRYQTGMSKYTNFIDDSRPLRPIARRTDVAVLQVANEVLRKSQDYDDNIDIENESMIPKLHRLSRIPPINPGSNASTA